MFPEGEKEVCCLLLLWFSFLLILKQLPFGGKPFNQTKTRTFSSSCHFCHSLLHSCTYSVIDHYQIEMPDSTSQKCSKQCSIVLFSFGEMEGKHTEWKPEFLQISNLLCIEFFSICFTIPNFFSLQEKNSEVVVVGPSIIFTIFDGPKIPHEHLNDKSTRPKNVLEYLVATVTAK